MYLMPGNLEIIDLFPNSEELHPHYRRREALKGVLEVVMASRAAIGEITGRSDELTEDDRFVTDGVAEMLHGRADELLHMLDK